ncbi:unnamed protein product [Didymodactylos carnosus]|uniref:Transmembrane protein n=1 Tax=Didymodactylos carnosus TaxID=1234261 RepID=A0A814PWQ8_9BILA|nr:unnamed protein product [Didymodactylos carnosus]CAF1111436.1 unnamed protein product [Didymodactylos carnosus]CAF3687848.1 unnamed protein product [Didymodactylos carnosus]CAF3875812.1 unnamed protein product [Didymodactylos carnosus]
MIILSVLFLYFLPNALSFIIGDNLATKSNANQPFLFLPQLMLPTTTTYQFTYEGQVMNSRISGYCYIEPVMSLDQHLIGYRDWQNFIDEFEAIFYGVSYLNGSRAQATIDPQNGICINKFTEIMNCVGWKQEQQLIYQNTCYVKQTNTLAEKKIVIILQSNINDPNKSFKISSYTTIEGQEVETKLYFTSENRQSKIPYVNCEF